MNYTMKVGIFTCITCMLGVALALAGPIRREASQTEKTVPIGGNVTLLCPFVLDDTWQYVYWKKNDHTIYSLEVQSNTPWTNDTRYKGRNNATRLTIKDLKKTDSGIYLCKVAALATTDFIKEGGQVLLSVTDQEVGLSTTSPGVSVRASSTIQPQPAEDKSIFCVILLLIPILFITMCFVWKYREGGFVIDFGRLGRGKLNECQLCNDNFEENISIPCLHPKFCRKCLEKNGLQKHDLCDGTVCCPFRVQQSDSKPEILSSMFLHAQCRRNLAENCNNLDVNLLLRLSGALQVSGDNSPELNAGSSPPPPEDSPNPQTEEIQQLV